MVWYKTKKEILERMGRHEKNVRSLDRAIKRGEVIEQGWMWGYKLDLLVEVIDKQKKEIEELKKSEFTWGDLEEALANAKYWEDRAREYAEYCDKIVDVCYWVVKWQLGSKFQQSKEEFKEGIQFMVKRD